jgi:hypothetical protein
MNWLRNSVFVFGALLIALLVGGAVCAGLVIIKTLIGVVFAGICTVLVLSTISAFIGYMITKGLEQ